MIAATFDTLEVVEILQEAGVAEAQAKAFVKVIQKSHDHTELTTQTHLSRYESMVKKDLEKLELKLGSRLTSLEERLESRHEIVLHEMRELGLSLIIWLGGIIVAAVSVLPLVFRFLHLA